MKPGQKTRTPLDAAPLRVAGQSLSDEIADKLNDHVMPALMAAAMALAFAVMEWLRYWQQSRPSPWLFSALAVAASAYAAITAVRAHRHVRNLRLGRDAESAVAQYLEWFRTAGFFVFHDVPNGLANIDHVLIGQRGIYSIETKAASKPMRGECKARVTDGQVLLNGRVMERNPLVQAKAQAKWLHNFFKEVQFKPYVQPVVVIPGWFVEPFDMRAAGAWVLEPKALDKFIANEPERLTRDEVRAMASALSSYIRAQSAL